MSNNSKKTASNYNKKLRRKLNKSKKIKALIQISNLNAQDSLKKPSKKKKKTIKRKSNELDDIHEVEVKRLRKHLKYPLNGQEIVAEEPPVFGELTDEQQRKVKKLLEERSKKRKDRPSIELHGAGVLADLTTPEDKRVPLTIDDYQHFIIYSLLHVMSTKRFSRWAQLMKSDKVKHRIFVVIEGVGLKEYLDYESDLATLKEFESRLEIVTPLSYGGNLIEELTMVPLTKSQRTRLQEEYGSLKAAMEIGEIHKALKTIFHIKKNTGAAVINEEDKKLIPTDKFSRKLLLLSPWEMVEENYPLPLSGNLGSKYKDYVFTRTEYEEVTDNSPMWSLDCEMCLTTKGSELTRVCIVNESHDIVYETLVKPHNPIVNYLTEYSGITRKMLENVLTRLEDVQKHICAICPPDLILVGQSLNGDLNALQMIHPYVIDTSVTFNISGVKHRKSKLRILTEEFLSERIQIGSKGHCPFEDALAAMKLVQAKLQHSVGWGNAVLSGPRPEEESLAARALLEHRDSMGDSKLKGMKEHAPLSSGLGRSNYELSSSLMSHLVRHDKNVLLVGKQGIIDEWSRYCKKSTAIELTSVSTDKAGVKFVRTHSPIGGTTILHLSLESRQPYSAISKADRLVEKLLRRPTPNTLYTILLAGRQGSPGNGLMFIHMLREHVPFVDISEKT